MAETLQFLADLILKHKVSPNPQGWDEGGQFVAGHLAMRTCGRWCIAGLLNNNFTDYDLQYQPHKSGPMKTVAGTDGWGISTSTKTPTGGVGSRQVPVEHGAPSTWSRAAATSRRCVRWPRCRCLRSTAPRTRRSSTSRWTQRKTVPAPTNFNIIDPILNRHYQTIWNGEKTVEEALAAATRAAG